MKNIVVFSDGTCNETDKGYPTNVLKLYKMIERRKKRQVAFYDPGVGTNLYKVTGSALGYGISKNIRECYEFIVDYYQPGDKIFLFGFSRGAYTVRSLGGLIKKAGILKRQYRHESEAAFKIYKKKNNKADTIKFRNEYCWQSQEGIDPSKAIYFIGVWDTVSALGIPLIAFKSLNPFSNRKHGFHDAHLCENVKYGYQALSIDEPRKIFAPEIWKESHVEGQTVEQVWFAGVHSNIGGGYRRSGLSDISLKWMIGKAKSAGLFFWDNYEDRVLMSPDSTGKIYNPREKFGVLYIKAVRKIPENSQIHETVFQRIKDEDSLYKPTNIPSS